jgi:hypothetical protein
MRRREGDACAAAARGPDEASFRSEGGGIFAETSLKEAPIRGRGAATPPGSLRVETKNASGFRNQNKFVMKIKGIYWCT